MNLIKGEKTRLDCHAYGLKVPSFVWWQSNVHLYGNDSVYQFTSSSLGEPRTMSLSSLQITFSSNLAMKRLVLNPCRTRSNALECYLYYWCIISYADTSMTFSSLSTLVLQIGECLSVM